MFVLVGAMEREVRCGSVVAIDLALTDTVRSTYHAAATSHDTLVLILALFIAAAKFLIVYLTLLLRKGRHSEKQTDRQTDRQDRWTGRCTGRCKK